MGTTTRLDLEIAVALQGTLDTFALPDVLRLLAATKKTGRLRITGPRGSGSVAVAGGAIGTIDVPHAAHVSEAPDALFELLRFDEGSFTFDADADVDPGAGAAGDLEDLLSQAEALLAEWREIESVVPSMDAWVTLRRSLVTPKVSIDRDSWLTVAVVGSGATVRRVSDELCLAELPVSRAVRDLVELGLVEIAPAAPQDQAPPRAPRRADVAAAPAAEVAPPATAEPAAGDPATTTDPAASDPAPVATDLPEHTVPPVLAADRPPPADDGELPTARPLRARRVKSSAPAPQRTEPEVFVPLELPGQGPQASYDPVVDDSDVEIDDDAPEADDLVAAFPGLAAADADLAPEDQELARQLATLSPKAARAVRAAAEATTAEQREAALADVDLAGEGEERPINRGLLLKFLSSVKS